MSPGYRKPTKTHTNWLLPLLVGLLVGLAAVNALAFDVRINGVEVELSTSPSLRQGKVMLPLSCLINPLGILVECEESEGVPIALEMGDRKVTFSTDSSQAMVDGTPLELGTIPYRKHDELMVPMNLFVNVLKINVEWDQAGQTLFIEGGTELPLEATTSQSDVAKEPEAAASIAAKTESAEPLQQEISDGLPDDEDSHQVEIKMENTGDTAEHGVYSLAISQFLQEMRTQTSALAGEKVFGQAQGIRLVGVLPSVEQGRQRLDFITDAPVKVHPMLLADPARLVVDVEEAIVDAIDDELYVGRGVIHRVRLSQYQEGVARAVVDLTEPTGYEIKDLTEDSGFSVVFNQRIGRVSLWRSGTSIGLKMETSGPVRYTVRRLISPTRIVVDVDNATFVAGAAEVNVNDNAVKSLRISQYTPTETRIVIDLEHALDIIDVDASTDEHEIELTFFDPQWGEDSGFENSGALVKTSEQDGGEAPFVSLRQLATLGRSLVELFPSSKALAMEENQLTDTSANPHDHQEEGWNLSVGRVDKLADDIEGDGETEPRLGVGSLMETLWVEPKFGQIRWDDLGEGSDVEPEGEPLISPPVSYSDDIPVPLSTGARQIDFSQWPRLQANWITADARTALQGRSILIDAGHGGFQPGAPGVNSIWEKTYNLELALRVGELLQWAGARVSYTRMTDQTISLRERVDMVQAVDAEILISIHANASLARDATGTETLYHPAIAESRSLAAAVQENLVSQLGLFDRGIKQRNDLYILRHSPVPSTLVEVGFLDHIEEGPFLLTPEAIDRASMGLVRGIAAFFRDHPIRPARAADTLKQEPPSADNRGDGGVQDSEGEAFLDGAYRGEPSGNEEEVGSGRPTGSDTIEQKL
ncbi:MAG: AMIN domain-containing protein [Firmicutes bacterium]|nr:AMIN domain-containing protein [Bacillota bacterium]